MNPKVLLSILTASVLGTVGTIEAEAQSTNQATGFTPIPAASSTSIKSDVAGNSRNKDLAQAVIRSRVPSSAYSVPVSRQARYYYYFPGNQNRVQNTVPARTVTTVAQPRLIYSNPAVTQARRPVFRNVTTTTPQYSIPRQSIALSPFGLEDRQSGSNQYIAIKGFMSKPQDYTLYEGTVGTDTGEVGVELKNGFTGLISGGYKLGNPGSAANFSIEIEGGYRQSSVDAVYSKGTDLSIDVGTSGKNRIFSGMINGIVELGGSSAVRPYIGGGVGLTRFAHKDYDEISIDDSYDTTGAYQGFAGIGFSMGSNTELLLEARHFVAVDVEKNFGMDVESKTRYTANEFGLGLKFNF